MVSATQVLASLALAASLVDAHTYITQPLTEFKSGASKSSWVAEFQPPWEGTFKTGAQFAAVAPGKGFKDLKSFLDDKGPECGNSLPNAKPKAIPTDGKVSIASTIEHAGPCEIWLDGVRAYQNDDCEKELGTAVTIPVDFSSCKGGCMLRFYWLGLQDGGKRWQAYKNCIPLGDGTTKAPSSGDTTPTTAPTTAPAATTVKPSSAPSPTTEKPAATPAPVTEKPTDKPATTPKPPKDSDNAGGDATTAPKPAATPKKCSTKRLRK